jgi:hypothetical protein
LEGTAGGFGASVLAAGGFELPPEGTDGAMVNQAIFFSGGSIGSFRMKVVETVNAVATVKWRNSERLTVAGLFERRPATDSRNDCPGRPRTYAGTLSALMTSSFFPVTAGPDSFAR